MSSSQYLKKITDGLKKFSSTYKHKGLLFISVILFVSFLLILQIFPRSTKLVIPVAISNDTEQHEPKEFSTFGGGVNDKIFIKDVEKDISEITAKYEEQKSNIKDLKDQQVFLAEYIQKIEGLVKKIDDRTAKMETNQTLNNLQNQIVPQQKEKMELEYLKIMPIEEKNKDSEVRLPIGSYAKGTLLTGVFAPVDSSNPLPVLIRLEEAFVGPNNSRVPLKGTFLIGKAYGDFTSHRALVQIISISTVLPDGRTFEKEGSFGYLTDDTHLFGITGLYVENTGKQLGLSFLSGFMSGASQAFADSETTTLVGSNGQVSKAVTGDSGKNASFQGLATSASQLSQYYQGQLEKVVPAVQIDPGKTVYFYVQKGVTVEGLKLTDNLTVQFID